MDVYTALSDTDWAYHPASHIVVRRYGWQTPWIHGNAYSVYITEPEMAYLTTCESAHGLNEYLSSWSGFDMRAGWVCATSQVVAAIVGV